MSSLRLNIKTGIYLQVLTIACTFLAVPLSISFLGKSEYGIWIGVYSIILMFNSCDLGIPSSTRNQLTNAITNNNILQAREILSTSYLLLCLISFVTVFFLYLWFSLSDFNIGFSFSSEFVFLFLLLIFFDYNLRLVLTVYTSHQKAYVVTLSTALINVSFLIFIFSCYKLDIGEDYKQYIFIFGFLLCSVIVNLSINLYGYIHSFKYILPCLSGVKTSYIKILVVPGLIFFIIQISMAILNQFVNIIILKYNRSEVLAEISVLDKYFGVIIVFGSVFLFPFWSKFTEKFTLGDYKWIRSCIFKLEIFFVATCGAALFMWVSMPYVIRFWIAEPNFKVESTLGAVVAVKYLAIFLNSIYSYFLNGIGKLRVQLVVYSLGSISVIVISEYLTDFFGVYGILLYVTFVFFLMAVLQKIEVNRILAEEK